MIGQIIDEILESKGGGCCLLVFLALFLILLTGIFLYNF